MAERSDDGIFKFMTGLCLGLIGGVAAGVILSSKEGKELRKDLELNSEELLHNLKDKLEMLKEKASVGLKDFRGFSDDKFKDSAINLQDKIQDLGRQLEELTRSNGDPIKAKKREIHS